MALILSIETATAVCSVCLSDGEKILALRETSEHNSHSRVVTVFVDEIFRETGIARSALDAVAVSKGPGSYTGLRIGVSTAKGLCYGLDKPLIGVATLESMAWGMKQAIEMPYDGLPVMYVPVIDARRMEVYTALFDDSLKQIRETSAEIIDAASFNDLTRTYRLILGGDGALKCRSVLNHPNIHIAEDFEVSARYMVTPANRSFEAGLFEDTAYFEPFYLKDFIAGKPKVKGLD
jgi:tRNA threonylcarbamoyladenosine biosynthesis protein TsaB